MSDQDLNIDVLKWRLAETITWCTSRGTLSDAAITATQLRTPELCPQGFVYYKHKYGYTDMEPSLGGLEPDAFRNVVEEVAAARARQLKLAKIYPSEPARDLAGGRLLFYAPYENLAEGGEEQYTNGFFDVRALPPWDTWLWFVVDHAEEKWYGYDTYLVSWVPHELVDIVSEGAVATSTTDALAWADVLNADINIRLSEAGIAF